MSIHDMNIANQTFPAFRADLNNALGALVSTSSNLTAPTTTYAHQFWANTSATSTVLKIRNKANNQWINIGDINEATNIFISGSASSSSSAGYASTVTVAARNTTNADHFVMFATAQTGNLPTYTDSGLKYNPSTNTLTANLVGLASSATTAAACTGNSLTATSATSATKLSTNRTNWVTDNKVNVVGQLGWWANGNNSTIFDVSNGTAPSGTSTILNKTKADVAWVEGSPTLVGWNGTSTHGVRVDSARVADSSAASTTSTTATTSNNVKVAKDLTNNLPTSATRHLTFVGTEAATQTSVLTNADLTYNPSTKTLTVANLAGNALTATSATSATTAGFATSAASATNSTNSTKVLVALDTDSSSSTVRYISFVGGTSGNQGVYADSGLTYNAQSDKLTASTFKGSLEGNALTATSATSATSATTATNATNASKLSITADNTGTTSKPLLFAGATTGNQLVYSDTGLAYKPDTNTLSCAVFAGNLTGNLIAATPTASTAAANTNTTQIATTAFVANAVSKINTLSSFTIEESGGNLLIKHNNTTVAKITSSGQFITASTITANGTP